MTGLLTLLLGSVSGAGLVLAGVEQPAVILHAFTYDARWDPRLWLFCAGAFGMALPLNALLRRRGVTRDGCPLPAPGRRPIDGRLIAGALLSACTSRRFSAIRSERASPSGWRCLLSPRRRRAAPVVRRQRGLPMDPIHASGGPVSGAPRIHLLLGPVGAGKSTFALRLAREQRAVPIDLDQWMTRLFRPDRPEHGVMGWYVERAERCVEQIWCLAERILDSNTSVVLEIGLIRRSDRERFFQKVDAAGRALTIHVLDAPRALRRARVEQRNAQRGETFSMEVPPDIFELASDLWEPLDAHERAGRDVRGV